MKLSDLSPRWIEPAQWAMKQPFYIGVSFLCPHCSPTASEHGPDRRRRLAVKFYPPIDSEHLDGSLFNWPDLGEHRRTEGDTFDTLTLHPSVGFDSIGHWHGRITKGEMQ